MKKLDTTRKILPETVLRVYRPGFGYARLTVVDVTEHYLACLCASDFFSHVSSGDRVDVYLWVEDVASYDFSTRVLGRLDPVDDKVPHILFLEHTREITRKEERRCLHANVSIPFRFFLFDRGKIDKNFSTEQIQFYDGTIFELGDREMFFRTELSLPQRHFLYGHLTLSDGQLEIIGKINSMENERNVYKASFPGISDKERNEILDYIFDVYRE